MKAFLLFLIFLFPVSLCRAQAVSTVIQPCAESNSFYDIERTGPNEFWLAGENGVVMICDSMGQLCSAGITTGKSNILKILNTDQFIFLASDNGILYRYNKLTGEITEKQFPEFSGRCIYDLAALPEGGFLACGGTSGISLGEKKVPRGFIATFDEEMNLKGINWTSTRHFVWSLETSGNEVYAAAFNGFNTTILRREDSGEWLKWESVKGLVHELSFQDGNLWYSGTAGIRYTRKGIYGVAGESSHHEVKDKGCIWSFAFAGNNRVMLTHSGEVLIAEKESLSHSSLPVSGSLTLYELVPVSSTRMLVTGHGGGLYLLILPGSAVSQVQEPK